MLTEITDKSITIYYNMEKDIIQQILQENIDLKQRIERIEDVVNKIKEEKDLLRAIISTLKIAEYASIALTEFSQSDLEKRFKEEYEKCQQLTQDAIHSLKVQLELYEEIIEGICELGTEDAISKEKNEIRERLNAMEKRLAEAVKKRNKRSFKDIEKDQKPNDETEDRLSMEEHNSAGSRSEIRDLGPRMSKKVLSMHCTRAAV